jgi:hypothetical protein
MDFLRVKKLGVFWRKTPNFRTGQGLMGRLIIPFMANPAGLA